MLVAVSSLIALTVRWETNECQLAYCQLPASRGWQFDQWILLKALERTFVVISFTDFYLLSIAAH